EVKAGLFDASTSLSIDPEQSRRIDKGLNKPVLNYIYGLGGRGVKLEDIESIYNDLASAVKGKAMPKVVYQGVRE
ncbi:MAG: pyruvate ferredoxin oxidoreductase, partial [Candidatus Omnitrophica bacterium]|nr:pyruvate ferredoxin oxidoreductase [Candidatus Omnitrophota bacterium]